MASGTWSRWQGSEGPEIVYHDGYYYLFMAYDGLDIPYNTRVVRSTRVDGPYQGIDGTNVTSPGGNAFPVVTHPYKFMDSYGWGGIAHCAVWEDTLHNSVSLATILVMHLMQSCWVVFAASYGIATDGRS